MRSILLLSLLPACVPAWPEGDDTGGGIPLDDAKVGFVYIGPVGDHGWTKSHDDGRIEMESALGVETTYAPSVVPADTVSTIEGMMDEGANIFFTTSFDFVSQTQQAASNYPDARFLNCSGGVYSDNLGSYMGRMYQAMYLAGMVAGKMTVTDRVAMVLSVPIPEIVRHVNAFTLGAREVNPDVEVEVVWVNNWFDAELEAELTNDVIARGADVINNQTDTTIPLETANGKTVTYTDGTGKKVTTPVYTIGYDNADSCTHAEESCLTSAYWNWGPMYTRLVQEIVDGTWDPSAIVWDQMEATPSESAVNLSDFASFVPGEVRLAVDERIPDLVDEEGSQLPFRGPLRDVAGTTRVSSGTDMTDEELNRMCWFVEGVIEDDDGTDVPAEVPAGCGGDF